MTREDCPSLNFATYVRVLPQRYPADKAYFIAKEILTTERTYLKDLEVITVVSLFLIFILPQQCVYNVAVKISTKYTIMIFNSQQKTNDGWKGVIYKIHLSCHKDIGNDFKPITHQRHFWRENDLLSFTETGIRMLELTFLKVGIRTVPE